MARTAAVAATALPATLVAEAFVAVDLLPRFLLEYTAVARVVQGKRIRDQLWVTAGCRRFSVR